MCDEPYFGSLWCICRDVDKLYGRFTEVHDHGRKKVCCGWFLLPVFSLAYPDGVDGAASLELDCIDVQGDVGALRFVDAVVVEHQLLSLAGD